MLRAGTRTTPHTNGAGDRLRRAFADAPGEHRSTRPSEMASAVATRARPWLLRYSPSPVRAEGCSSSLFGEGRHTPLGSILDIFDGGEACLIVCSQHPREHREQRRPLGRGQNVEQLWPRAPGHPSPASPRRSWRARSERSGCASGARGGLRGAVGAAPPTFRRRRGRSAGGCRRRCRRWRAARRVGRARAA
jgi:hypothetical protein